MTPPGSVDIHSHLYPRSYMELLKARTEIPRIAGEAGDERFVIFPGEAGRPMGRDHWDLGEKLAFMERWGIGVTVLSLGNPWLDPFPGPEAPGLARRVNKEFASYQKETGGRILGMGVLPNGQVASAVEVAREIAESLSLYAVASGPRMCGRTLDDDALDPLWAVLEETGLPLFLHPHYSVGGEQLEGFGHAFPVAMGFPFETTIAVARLVFAGVLQRHPGLKVIASHGGGTIPYLAGRLNAGWRSDPGLRERLPVPPLEELRKLYLDAVLYDPIALRTAAELVGTEKMAFGTDHPFSVADPETNLAAIDEAFGEDGRTAVLERSPGAFLRLERR